MAFLSNARNVQFDFNIKFESLDNITLINNLFYLKWNLAGSSGSTENLPVSGHSVKLDINLNSKLKIPHDRAKRLTHCNLSVRVGMIKSNNKKARFGDLVVNLSEYARFNDTSRRFILQNCKVNATLKISISATQIAGITDFITPALNRNILLKDIGEYVYKADINHFKDSNSENSSSSRGLSSIGNVSSQNTSKNSDGLFSKVDDSALDSLSPYKDKFMKNQKLVDDIFDSVFRV
ncbi:hypothetical protein BB560_000525 [Smittium megazygosporum]|uniref:C2 NT-type domain-containing protein n=1 Tax=Smittium megazygosporum TaxID=133381 RepID=A0A2T9ZK33_9FUNG|nr:hypothetical protein BB560_000525 [Smittium megazygosporum]